MGVPELKSEVAQLPPSDLAAFALWFEGFVADAWDRQIEEDIQSGKLDFLANQANVDFESGRCTPL